MTSIPTGSRGSGDVISHLGVAEHPIGNLRAGLLLTSLGPPLPKSSRSQVGVYSLGGSTTTTIGVFFFFFKS